MSDFQENDEKERAANNVSVNQSSSSDDDSENESFPSKKQKHGHPFPESESSHSYMGKSEDPQVQIGDPSVTCSTKTAVPANAKPESGHFEKVSGHSREGETDSAIIPIEVQEKMKNTMKEKERIASNPPMATANKERISETGSRHSSMGKEKEPLVRIGDQLSTSSNETTAVTANPEQGAFQFKKQLSHTDASGCRLYIPKEDAQKYFPPLESPFTFAIVEFYDPEREKWWKTIVTHETNDAYLIALDWLEFVNERGLVAGDFLLFYGVKNLHVDEYPYQYVIRIEKATKKNAETSVLLNDQSDKPGIGEKSGDGNDGSGGIPTLEAVPAKHQRRCSSV